VLTLDSALEFDPSRDEDFFIRPLPAHPAVCLIEPKETSAQPLFIRTPDFAAACNGCSVRSIPQQTAELRDFAKSIRYRTRVRVRTNLRLSTRTPGNFFQTVTRRCCASTGGRAESQSAQRPIRAATPTRKIPSHRMAHLPAAFITDHSFPQAAESFCRTRARSFQGAPLQIKIRRDPTFLAALSEMKMCSRRASPDAQKRI